MSQPRRLALALLVAVTAAVSLGATAGGTDATASDPSVEQGPPASAEILAAQPDH